MSKEDAIKEIESALQKTEKWTQSGWNITFGRRNVEVNNKPDAEKLPFGTAYGLEAQEYWNMVELISKDCVTWGRRAIESLKKGDMRDADDSVYFAMHWEKQIDKSSPTWASAYSKVKSLS